MLLLLSALLLGNTCGEGNVPLRVDSQGTVTGQPGAATILLARDAAYLQVHVNTLRVDQHPDWTMDWDSFGPQGEKRQDAPGDGWGMWRQSAPSSAYPYRGPSIWHSTRSPGGLAGEEVAVPAPRVVCVNPAGCSGPPPRITAHDYRDDVGNIAYWWNTNLAVDDPRCEQPNYVGGCFRRRLDAVQGAQNVVRRRMTDGQLCANCHVDDGVGSAFALLPGVE